LKRNDKVALYGIGGEFTDSILHWEVDIIYIRKDKYGEGYNSKKKAEIIRLILLSTLYLY
jgi:hypothetical protein